MVYDKEKLGRQLILDELLDLSLYRALNKNASGSLKAVLESLIPMEVKHVKFWQDFFGRSDATLDFGRKMKLAILLAISRVFGERAIHLILEATEVYGIRKYLAVWETYKDTSLGDSVREILTDEFQHEDAIMSELFSRKVNPEKIRFIFLGFNDGLVEILGAVSGFFAAFQSTSSVLVASLTVAVAGAFSMAAGAYVASSSEHEIEELEAGKRRFFDRTPRATDEGDGPLHGTSIVGVSYFIGAMVPILPVLFGARSMVASAVSSAAMVILVSLVLSFVSGMDVKKRIARNLVIITGAVLVTYAIGLLARAIWGIHI
jgi:VIT1/CCC1 family predicted Fe2+/Mn2+ transporter